MHTQTHTQKLSGITLSSLPLIVWCYWLHSLSVTVYVVRFSLFPILGLIGNTLVSWLTHLSWRKSSFKLWHHRGSKKHYSQDIIETIILHRSQQVISLMSTVVIEKQWYPKVSSDLHHVSLSMFLPPYHQSKLLLMLGPVLSNIRHPLECKDLNKLFF